MGFAACADWDDTGVCDSLLGVDGLLCHIDFWADVCSIYFVFLPDISFPRAILCDEPFGLACVVYVGVIV